MTKIQVVGDTRLNISIKATDEYKHAEKWSIIGKRKILL